jgi:hypothetical protein
MNITIIKKPLALVLPLLFVSSISQASQFPDSLDLNSNMSVNLSHRIDGKQINSNPLVNTDYGSWSSWETSSDMFDCTEWTPSPDTVKLGVKFEQYRNCQGEETRTRTVTYRYSNGTVVNEVETETELSIIDDGQYAIGTMNYIVSQEVKYTNWDESGDPHSCTSWSPSPSTIDKGVGFTQKRTCTQDMERIKSTFDVWADGSKTLNNEKTESQTTKTYENRHSVGTKLICPASYTYKRIVDEGSGCQEEIWEYTYRVSYSGSSCKSTTTIADKHFIRSGKTCDGGR